MSFERCLAVARLVGLLEKIEGRKRLQKIVHLLKSKGYREFDQEFSLHHYGPFSRQLAAQIDSLCQMKLISEAKDDSSDTYVYKPVRTEVEGKELSALDELAGEQEEPPWGPTAKSLDEKETSFLEALSTVVYLHGIGRRAERLQEAFCRIKPKLEHLFQKVKSYATTDGWIGSS